MTYDKEKMLNMKEQEYQESKDKKPKSEKFIWSYIIRPVRKDFDDK
jgi:hypothetical protein